METKSLKILLGCTGSVASIKVLSIAGKLKSFGHSIVIVPTERSLHFIKCQAIADGRESKNTECNHCSKICLACEIKNMYEEFEIITDSEEWECWQKREDPIKHIDLGKWADLFLICPLDANTLAKISNGLCDNLLTCVARAWDVKKPLVFCLAMNTKMYEHPLTMKQALILKELGYREIPSISKKLMCGDTGIGAMAEVNTIVDTIQEIVQERFVTDVT